MAIMGQPEGIAPIAVNDLPADSANEAEGQLQMPRREALLPRPIDRLEELLVIPDRLFPSIGVCVRVRVCALVVFVTSPPLRASPLPPPLRL